jgi:hypothetical protein
LEVTVHQPQISLFLEVTVHQPQINLFLEATILLLDLFLRTVILQQISAMLLKEIVGYFQVAHNHLDLTHLPIN